MATRPEDIESRKWIQEIESELARRHNWAQQERNWQTQQEQWQAERKHWRNLAIATVVGPSVALVLVALRLLDII